MEMGKSNWRIILVIREYTTAEDFSEPVGKAFTHPVKILIQSRR